MRNCGVYRRVHVGHGNVLNLGGAETEILPFVDRTWVREDENSGTAVMSRIMDVNLG